LYVVGMYIATIPNRNSPPAILLREAFRENGKVKNRTLANLSLWPPARVEALRRALRGDFDHAQPAPPRFGPFKATTPGAKRLFLSKNPSRPHGNSNSKQKPRLTPPDNFSQG